MTSFVFTVPDAWVFAIATVIKNDEGGFVLTENANDPGGLTYAGMTYRTFSEEMEQYGERISAETFKASALNKTDSGAAMLFSQRIMQVYYNRFVLPCCLVGFPHTTLLLSASVNCGVVNCGKIIQNALNDFGFKLVVDGKIGPRTMDAMAKLIQNIGFEQLKRKLIIYWRKYYIDLVQDNCDAWDDYTDKLEMAITSHIAGDKNIEERWPTLNAPKYRRWKDLEGWMNRVERYV